MPPPRPVTLLLLLLLLLLGYDFWQDSYASQLFHYVFSSRYYSIDGAGGNCSRPPVPHTVHWIWIHQFPSRFQFHEYLSALSVLQHVQPAHIYLWYSSHPQGPYWTQLLQRLHNSSSAFHPQEIRPPTSIHGRPIHVPEHQADIVKIQKLLQYGGIYLDFDVIVVKSFGPLRCYPATLGMEAGDRLCAGVIISEPNGAFLQLWLHSYKTFDDSSWDEHAVRMPYRLWRRHPQTVHVESSSLHHPSWQKHELPYLYSKGMYYDWQARNYAVHLWYRFYNVEHDKDSIRTLDSTVGQLFRYVYYGETRLLPDTGNTKAKEIYLQF